jgi:hypothetical protein
VLGVGAVDCVVLVRVVLCDVASVSGLMLGLFGPGGVSCWSRPR